MPNKDLKLLDAIIKTSKITLPLIINEVKKSGDDRYSAIDFDELEYPLDRTVLLQLNKLKDGIRDTDDDYHIFNSIEMIKGLWKLIIEKSIKCLRF